MSLNLLSSTFYPQSSTFYSNGLRQFLRFQAFDSRAEPILDCVLGFALVLIPLQLVDGTSHRVKRNVVARHRFRSFRRRNEVYEQAFGAGMSSFGIAEIEAAWRILENRSWLPGCLDRTAVTTLLDEVQFSFQHLETVAIILIHQSPPRLIRTFSLSSKPPSGPGLECGSCSGVGCRSRRARSARVPGALVHSVSRTRPRGYLLWNVMRLGAAFELILLHLERAVRCTHARADPPEPFGLCAINRDAMERDDQLPCAVLHEGAVLAARHFLFVMHEQILTFENHVQELDRFIKLDGRSVAFPGFCSGVRGENAYGYHEHCQCR